MRRAKKIRRRHPVMVILTCLALAGIGALWPAVALVALCGMLPTLVIVVIDWSEDKAVACTVGALNFAGVFPFLPSLWLRNGGGSPDGILADAVSLIFMYLAAAMGWMLVALLPALIEVLDREAVKRRCVSLRQQQRRLVEEWGNAPASGLPSDVC